MWSVSTFAIVLCLMGIAFAQSTQFSTNFLVTAKGETEDKLDSFNIVNNTGRMTISGVEYSALAYWTQVMETFRSGGVWWINIVGIALDGSNLAIVYIDCTNNTLQSDYWEEDWNTFLASKVIKQDYVGVSCDFQHGIEVSIPVSLPQLTAIPTSPFSTGITITNTSSNLISFENDGGWIIMNGMNFTIIPISTVNCWNCASNCGNYSSTDQSSGNSPDQPNIAYGCFPGPWYEIHHAAVSGDTICFGIFYLFRHDRSFVQWNYTFCTPEVESPMQLYLAAWDGRLNGNGNSFIPSRLTEGENEEFDLPITQPRNDIEENDIHRKIIKNNDHNDNLNARNDNLLNTHK